jgi:methylmalonyl-CoA/ethylmalonyl-CoA epimerase
MAKLQLRSLGQLALTVLNVDEAEHFYGETLGLRKLYRFGGLLFYDLDGVRLLIEASEAAPSGSTLYFRCPDLLYCASALQDAGVDVGKPNRIAEMQDHDLWMAFFLDPSGNQLALMQEAPKGYAPND